MPHDMLLNDDMTLKQGQELIDLIKKQTGVKDPTTGQIVVSCQVGFTASSLCVALEQLGNQQVSLYDGSFQEYSYRIAELEDK